jgi:hypothetical protein
MVNQARFKPSELILAASEAVFSRYMISPSRPKPGQTAEAEALACGLLGGFGGFLLQRFREHDFILGQRNCQKFLEASFALPIYNKIVQRWPAAAQRDPDFTIAGAGGAPAHGRIIPLLGAAKPEVLAPTWPRIKQDEFDTLQARIEPRLDAVADRLIAAQGPGGVMGWLVSFFYSRMKRSVLDFIKRTMLADLVRRDQIEGWALPAQWRQPPAISLDEVDVRQVLAALLDPSFDLRTAAGISASSRVEITKVTAILAACQAEAGKPYEVWQAPQDGRSGAILYALASRKPSWFQSLPGIRAVSNKISPPRTDMPRVA